MTIELVTEHLKLSDVMLGYPILMGEVMEEAVDELLKKPSTPWRSKSEIPFVRKYFIQEKIETTGLEPGQIRHWISTTAIDRDGEIMVPRGMDAKHYKKNPVVFWGHNYSEPENTIAKNLSLVVNDKGIMALTQFAGHNKASMIYEMYAGDFLRAWSVGFIPVKGKPAVSTDKPEVPEGMFVIDLTRPKPGELKYTHEKWMLLEYSACGVPCNPEALTEEVAKGNIEVSDRLLEEMQFKLEEINQKKKSAGWKEKSYVFYTRDGGDEKEKQTVEGEAPAEAKAEGEEADKNRIELWHDECGCGDGKGLSQEELKEEYEKGDPITYNDVIKPYPNVHACRLREPGDFDPDSFRTTSRDHEGKKYSVIMGKIKGETTMTEQAYRYPKSTWDADEARAHCKSHDGRFEAASEQESLSRDDVRAIVRDVVKEIDEELKKRGPEFVLFRDISLAPEPVLNLSSLTNEVVAKERSTTDAAAGTPVPETEKTSVTVTKEQLAAVVKEGLKALDEAGFKVILKNSVDMVIGRG